MPYTILYVEDESAIIELVDIVLAHPKIKLLTAYNGEKGLRLAQEHKPDLIVLDVMIPDRNGWSIYADIRGDADLHDRPIIMLTGQIHKYRIMKEFASSNIDAYITKPFEVGSIRSEIEKMLGVLLWSAQPVAPKRSRG
jgi:two-component system, OmpR family, response regulator